MAAYLKQSGNTLCN